MAFILQTGNQKENVNMNNKKKIQENKSAFFCTCILHIQWKKNYERVIPRSIKHLRVAASGGAAYSHCKTFSETGSKNIAWKSEVVSFH